MTEKIKIKMMRGFSMLEVLVVIAIIGIISSVTLVSMKSTREGMALKSAQGEVSSAISQAQSYALHGKIPASESDVCGYGFEFISQSQYRIFYWKKTPNPSPPPNLICDAANLSNTVDVEVSQPFKGNIALSTPALSASTILFDIPNGNATVTSNEYILESPDHDTRKISVNSKGLPVEK